jgi:hypothetical protein
MISEALGVCLYVYSLMLAMEEELRLLSCAVSVHRLEVVGKKKW